MTTRTFMAICTLAILSSTLIPITQASTLEVREGNTYVRMESNATGSGTSRIYQKTVINGKETIREEYKSAVAENNQARMDARAEFKEKLSELKDARKKEIVEKLDARFATVNKKATGRFLETLDKLSDILKGVQKKATEAKTAGKDTTEAQTSITAAQSAIDAAKTAVTTQSAKTYTITISTEDKLRMDVGTTASSLHADLRSVHKLVSDAKQAVVKAARLVNAL